MFTRSHLKFDKTGRYAYTEAEMRDLALYCGLGKEQQGAAYASQQGADSGREERGRGCRRSNRLIRRKRGVGFKVPLAEFSSLTPPDQSPQ